MARGNVRQHTRRMANGQTTTVHQHRRQTRRGLSPRHAGKLARQAFRNWGRKRRVTALVLGGLALGELGAWVGLRGTFFMLTTVGVLALGVAMLAASASGGEPGRSKGTPARRAPQRGRTARRQPKDGGSA